MKIQLLRRGRGCKRGVDENSERQKIQAIVHPCDDMNIEISRDMRRPGNWNPCTVEIGGIAGVSRR